MNREALEALRENAARAICAETCAFFGDPPCHRVAPDEWPNPRCDEPGCQTLAAAAVSALLAEGGE